MTRIGYFLASEEHGPKELVDMAQRAEDAGFEGLWLSDHYHPWIDAQGQSPFVWCVIGGIARTTTLPAHHGRHLPHLPSPPGDRRPRGGDGRGLTMAGLKVSWAEDEATARRIAHERWPNEGLEGNLAQELPMPAHFEQATALVTEDRVAELVPCGPDPKSHLDAIGRYVEGGFDEVYVSQVGPDQEGFFRFFERELRPLLQDGQDRR